MDAYHTDRNTWYGLHQEQGVGGRGETERILVCRFFFFFFSIPVITIVPLLVNSYGLSMGRSVGFKQTVRTGIVTTTTITPFLS